MGKFCRVVLFLSVIGAAVLYHKFRVATGPLPAPAMDLNAYWGPGDASNYVEDKSVKPLEIFYDEKTIAALRRKLNETLTLHNPLEGMKSTHDYGLNPITLINLVEHWRNVYMPKWSERQKLLNSVPHFQTQIQGLKIHFIHIKPTPVKGKTIVPLLLLHGWPGSVREFYDFFPLLTKPNDKTEFMFEVIAPSLPGFVWSEAASKVGFGPAEIGVVLRNLMIRLGHSKFLVQGGDWGSFIGTTIATLFPENVIGFHSNFCTLRTTLTTLKLLVSSIYPTAFVDRPEYISWVYPIGEKFRALLMMSGYFHLQATKPDTIGIALTNNPVGLAAYFYEKFVSAFPSHNIDDVLDNIMMYYLTNSAHTAGRIYAEAITDKQNSLELARVPTHVPVACARFRRDISHMIDWQLIDKFPNLVQSTWHEDGGHFAAMEVPKTLYWDYIKFVKKALRK